MPGQDRELHAICVHLGLREAHRRVQLRLLCELIYAGVGIGLLPAAEVRRGQRDGTLERVLPTWEYAPIPVWVVSPKGRLALPRVARVVEVLARAVAALN